MEKNMAETPSTMIPLGTKAPDFRLLDTVSNRLFTLQELNSETATVIAFICNHCPYVKLIQTKFAELAREYQKKGISFIAISSNDAANYPADSPEKMHDEAIQHHYSFPYLYDETQEVARAYHAACTPDFYIFDQSLLCVYRGRFDDSTPGNGRPVTGRDLQEALDNIIAGKPVHADQKASVGCNIKWKK
jgi:peroxiredoxin